MRNGLIVTEAEDLGVQVGGCFVVADGVAVEQEPADEGGGPVGGVDVADELAGVADAGAGGVGAAFAVGAFGDGGEVEAAGFG
jgi:hypothetical protein